MISLLVSLFLNLLELKCVFHKHIYEPLGFKIIESSAKDKPTENYNTGKNTRFFL